MTLPSAQRTRELLQYIPETGLFIRRVTVSNALAGSVAGTRNKKGYVYIRVDGVNVRACRLAWLYMTGTWPTALIDHINRDRSDDSWANLRIASHAENCANAKRRSDNTSGIKGVRAFRGRYQARIGTGGHIHLGTFDTAQEAAAAYRGAAKVMYGDFGSPE